MPSQDNPFIPIHPIHPIHQFSSPSSPHPSRQHWPGTINIIMSRSQQKVTDPAFKEVVKNKIQAEIEKMRAAEEKGDTEAMEKIMILNERIRLINSCRPLDETRIANLQKLFKHYCQNRQKPSNPMSFDEINYQYEHLTIERFFIFIRDFKLNEIPTDDGNRLLTDRNNIILLFKKVSSNVRLLSFHEFVIAIERLFVILFNETQNYDKKVQKAQDQKKLRLDKYQKREQKKRLKYMKKHNIPIKEKKLKAEQKPAQAQEEEQESQSEEEEEEANKTAKGKTSPKTPAPASRGQGETSNQQPVAKSTENDEMVKSMMKDFEIVNPTDEVKKAVKEVNKAKGREEEDEEAEIEISFDPYSVTDEEKIESYMLRIGTDNYASMEKKMMQFEKMTEKYEEVDFLKKSMEVKKSKMKFLKKDELTHYESTEMHEEWSPQKKMAEEYIAKRMKSIKEIIHQKSVEKSRSFIAEVIPKEIYETKKRRGHESFQKRQRDLMRPIALARITKMKEQEEENNMQFSLQMIHRSSPNQLPFNKINPERYAAYDPSDRIFLNQFSVDSERAVRGLAPRAEMSLVESTKRRAKQIEEKEAKKLISLAENKFKNPHYLEKFLERKW